MDLFRLCLAFGPIAIYLLLLGGLHCLRRPFLVSGTRDTATLGIAVSGMVLVGPIELFMPIAASVVFGSFVWVFLISLYVMMLVLVLLTMRPRLVIYNISTDELRPVLADLVARLDSEARWAGDSLVLPDWGIQLHIEGVGILRNVSLISSGPKQDQQNWHRLESALAHELNQLEVTRSARGIRLMLILAGGLISAVLIAAIACDPQSVAQSMFEMFQI